MPIYEFYCDDCNTLFNFFSRSINTRKKPKCPRCKQRALTRMMSAFAVTGKAKEDGGPDDLPFDESRMENAMQTLAGEAESINEDDPRQAANLMRKLTDMTGLELGPGMTEALPEDIRKAYLDIIPLKKFGLPKDVASAVIFLLSDDAAYITGQVIHVNGGLYM